MRAVNGVRGWRMTSSVGPDSTISAAVDHQYAMGQQQRVEEIVGDDDRGPVGQHLPQHPAEQRGGADIQGGQRFVEQQQPRVRGQGPGDRHPLRLTPGQLCGLPGGELGRFDLLQPAPSGAPGLRGALAGGLGAESDVVENTQMGEQQRILGQQGHPPVPRRQPSARPAGTEVEQGSSVDLGVAGVGTQHTGQNRQQGGLPGTVGSEQRDPFPGCELEGDVEVPGGERGPHGDGHGPSRDPWASPTTTTATATRTSDNATAASASVSRCR